MAYALNNVICIKLNLVKGIYSQYFFGINGLGLSDGILNNPNRKWPLIRYSHDETTIGHVEAHVKIIEWLAAVYLLVLSSRECHMSSTVLPAFTGAS